MQQRGNPWRTLSSTQIYDNPWIALREDRALSPGGTEARYGVVTFKKLAIGVLPIEPDGRVHLVGQWRYPLGAFCWEIPEGGGEAGADPLEEARRELLEETGLEAAEWREILRMHLSNSTTDEASVIYLATGLRRIADPQPEASEQDMEQDLVPFRQALRRVAEGEITDSLTVAALLRAHQMAVEGEIAPALAEAMLKGAP